MFMNFDFGNGFSQFTGMIDTYDLEIYIGNNVKYSKLSGIRKMVEAQVYELLQEAKDTGLPYKIKVSKPEKIWDKFENKEKTISNYLQVANEQFIKTHPNEFKGDING